MNLLEKFSSMKINESEMIVYVKFCKDNAISKIKGETSHHHILPVSLFKQYSDLKLNAWNGVHLTYANHYKAHYLLTKAIDDFGQLSAFVKMNNCDIKNGKIEEKDLIPAEEFQNLMELRGKKHKIYLQVIEKNGKTRAVNAAIKASNTMKKIKPNGLSIYEEANIKQHETKRKNGIYKIVGKKMVETKKLDLDENGINGLQRHSIKASNTMKKIKPNGLSTYEEANIKRLDSVYKNQKNIMF